MAGKGTRRGGHATQPLTEVKRRAAREAESQGLILLDAAIVRENTGRVLRFTIDKDDDAGVTLDDCERYHRAILKLADDVDYDYMEVTSPGADRPLKTERDFERAAGQGVEAHFYRQIDGAKQISGRLTGWDADSVTIETAGGEQRVSRADIALIRMTLDEEELDSPLFEALEATDDGQNGISDADGEADDESEA